MRKSLKNELDKVFYNKDINEILEELNEKFPILIKSKELKFVIKETKLDNPALDEAKIDLVVRLFIEALRDLSFKQNDFDFRSIFYFRLIPKLFISHMKESKLYFYFKPYVKLFESKL